MNSPISGLGPIKDPEAIAKIFGVVADLAKATAAGEKLDQQASLDRIFEAAGLDGVDRLDAAMNMIPAYMRPETVLMAAAKYPAWAGVAASLVRGAVLNAADDPSLVAKFGVPVTTEGALAGMETMIDKLVLRSGIPAGPEGFAVLDGIEAAAVAGVLSVWLEDYSTENSDYQAINAVRDRLAAAVSTPTKPAP